MFPETNPAPGFKQHPDHEVKSKPYRGTITVHVDGHKVAESRYAMLVEETNHQPIYYLPVDDIDESVLRPSHHVTRCPFKGKARFWNVQVGEHEIDNALWAYELPYDEVLELAGLAAFAPSKVQITVEES